MIALTSNLPYLLALALVQSATAYAESQPIIKQLIAGSFTSATRVAASSPELPVDMFLTNTNNVIPAIDELTKQLNKLKALIMQQDEHTLRELINKCRQQHHEMIFG